METTMNATPSDDPTRLIVRDEIAAARRTHGLLCPFTTDAVATRLRQMEISYARLVGLMVGSGFLSGSACAALMHWLS
jgi:hypothetical protein